MNNNHNIDLKLNEGGYFFPIRIVEQDEAKDFYNYYKEKKNLISQSLLFEHKFKEEAGCWDTRSFIIVSDVDGNVGYSCFGIS